MKKLSLLFCIGVLCCGLSGCIDIVQHISRSTDGKEQNIIKITISKTMLEMIAGMSEKSLDINSFFDEMPIQASDIDRHQLFSTKVSKINTEFDIGYLINMKINYNDKNTVKALNAEALDFIPRYGKKMMSIHISSLKDDEKDGDSSSDNEMLNMMASGKYRLFISKMCMPSVSKAVVKTAQKTITMDVLDLNHEYLIEVPIQLLFTGATDIDIHQ